MYVEIAVTTMIRGGWCGRDDHTVMVLVVVVIMMTTICLCSL